MFSKRKLHSFTEKNHPVCSTATAIKKCLNGHEQLNFLSLKNQYHQERNPTTKQQFPLLIPDEKKKIPSWGGAGVLVLRRLLSTQF